ncbi:hypothetical protein [uncultured Parabacteroides sp.]|jgi:hypothetical protein|uniref:hypothetical protein n=1 Tax=uncultured Parabacteroides sp. TaxID=512312 RepID=UPI0025E1CA43|nr:hypothetical protein [uncultured Parabacteroides sp.]
MEKLKLFETVCISFMMCLLVACSDSDFFKEEFEEIKFEQEEDGEWSLSDAKPVTKAEFEKNLVGNGWKWVATREIDVNGKCSENDYYEDLIGIGPSKYYFGKDTYTEFFYFDAEPANCYREQTYTYEEKDNTIQGSTYPFPFMKILSLDSNTLKVIEFMAFRGGENFTKIYGCSIYTKMTDEELEKCRKDYPINYKDIGRPK